MRRSKGEDEDSSAGSTSLGTLLMNLRNTRGMTLREVEEACDVSNAYLSQLEHGKINKPSPHVLHELAGVYRVSYELLMEKAGYLSTGNKQSGGRGRSARLPLFAGEKLSPVEEEALLEYLAFLRSRGTKK